MADDEQVSQFMAFSGCSDPARAASYLEMSGGNLETAVSLYMEHEQGGGGGGAGAAAAAQPEIRAPDQVQTMRLMDDNVMHQDPAFQLMNAMMEEQLAQSAFADSNSSNVLRDVRAAVNAAAGTDDEDEDDDYEMDGSDGDDGNGTGDGPSTAAAAPRLSDMFAAPMHLMHTAGGFQGARAMAKDTKRWLLVNIQSDNEFSSHALNRDVWRDELVENLVREGFIFWQQFNVHPDGRTYTERYNVNSFPHIGIVDPRTGRLMWRKEGWTQEKPLTAAYFSEMAMDFCSRNTFDRPPQAPRASNSRPAKRPMHEMSEDEQMQAALRASMQEEDKANGDENSVEYVADSDEEGAEETKKPAAEPPKNPNDDFLAVSLGDEPASGARLQLRMPDGKRVVRKFANSDAVKSIYAFVAQINDEARGGKEFMLQAGFPPSDLFPRIDETIEECKLSGQAITVRWKG